MPGQAFQISNEFGVINIEPVTDTMPINQITSIAPEVQGNFFDITTAEQIALITENRGVQICFAYPFDGRGYMVLQDSPSTAAICRVSVEHFHSEHSPAATLEKINRTPVIHPT